MYDTFVNLLQKYGVTSYKVAKETGRTTRKRIPAY